MTPPDLWARVSLPAQIARWKNMPRNPAARVAAVNADLATTSRLRAEYLSALCPTHQRLNCRACLAGVYESSTRRQAIADVAHEAFPVKR